MLAAAQIIDAIAQRLGNVSASAGRVYTSRTWPLTDADLPAWRVLADDEAIASTTVHWPPLQTHELTAQAEGYCRATADLDDAMHDLAAAGIRAVLGTKADAELQPLRGVSVSLASIQREMTSLNEAACGRITVTFNVQFSTLMDDPETLV